MTRYTFGAGGDGEINSATTGLPIAGVTVNVYNARTGGVQITDLQNMSGGTITQATSDASGQFAFKGPDGYTDTLWLDLGTTSRWAMRPVELGAIASAVATTTAAATIASTRASDYTNRTFTAKSALPKNANDPLEEALTTVLDPLVIPRFGSSGARNTAFPSPANGDRCYRTDLAQMERYDGAAATWLPSEHGAWAPYFPTWGSSGSAPAIGNGTYACKYMRLGKTVWVAFQLTPGSTTTFGTGVYNFSLPVVAATTAPIFIGQARLNAGSTWAGVALVSTSTTFQFSFSTSSTDPRLTNMTEAAPETFANGHILRANFCYELA